MSRIDPLAGRTIDDCGCVHEIVRKPVPLFDKETGVAILGPDGGFQTTIEDEIIHRLCPKHAREAHTVVQAAERALAAGAEGSQVFAALTGAAPFLALRAPEVPEAPEAPEVSDDDRDDARDERDERSEA